MRKSSGQFATVRPLISSYHGPGGRSSLAAAKASLRNWPKFFIPEGLTRYHTLSFGFRW